MAIVSPIYASNPGSIPTLYAEYEDEVVKEIGHWDQGTNVAYL